MVVGAGVVRVSGTEFKVDQMTNVTPTILSKVGLDPPRHSSTCLLLVATTIAHSSEQIVSLDGLRCFGGGLGGQC